MDADEQSPTAAAAAAVAAAAAAAASLSTNATAFCIASLLAATDRDQADHAQLMTSEQHEEEPDNDDHLAGDTDDDVSESKISGETSCRTRKPSREVAPRPCEHSVSACTSAMPHRNGCVRWH